MRPTTPIKQLLFCSWRPGFLGSLVSGTYGVPVSTLLDVELFFNGLLWALFFSQICTICSPFSFRFVFLTRSPATPQTNKPKHKNMAWRIARSRSEHVYSYICSYTTIYIYIYIYTYRKLFI